MPSLNRLLCRFAPLSDVRWLNEKGIVHLIPLLLILGGLVAGLYLVQNPQIFNPKASAPDIAIEGSCVKTEKTADGKTRQVLTCANVQIKFTSPLEKAKTSDASFQLVKEAYAHTSGLDEEETRKCNFNGPLGMHTVSSNKNRVAVETCWPSGQKCQNYNFGDGHAWARCVIKTFPTCDGEITHTNGRYQCVVHREIEPSSPAPTPAPQTSADPIISSGDRACSCDPEIAQDVCIGQKFEDTCGIPICRGVKNCDGDVVITPVPTLAVTPTPRATIIPTPAAGQGGNPLADLTDSLVDVFRGEESETEQTAESAGTGGTPPAGSPQVTTTPTSTPVLVTRWYRFAESPEELKTAIWKHYTAGGSTETNFTFKDTNPGVKNLFAQFSTSEKVEDADKGIVKTSAGGQYAALSIELVLPTVSPLPTASPTPTRSAGGVCPDPSLAGNYDSRTLMDLCLNNLKQVAKIDLKYLNRFSNTDLVAIGHATGNLGKFLAQFSGERLVGTGEFAGSGFGIDILKQLPCDRILDLPQYVQDQINQANGSLCLGKITPAPGQAAKCTSLVATATSVYTSFTPTFSGTAASLKIWIASNSEVGVSPKSVASWTPVKTISSPTSGQIYSFDNLSDIASGSHGLMMTLHDSSGNMTDGNVGGRVNLACATQANY